ncbi:hypothetical protein DL766_001714 [Monosporascus sp. MC13-8B]|uniref:Uncharacterized protein n=1 Tax=Monosporascus cannonballus TaxID=155416 RepID=A0ABY0H5D6_9PEZI|nr:hypothetical protein DL763_009584 [Monosporascus cannonballus]RYO85290.1 hypothetical protein DL762_005243 [Monosporascus cannonballus]RYP36957.1 hypothetical protein DL766_001714 [Monosporascus sp. MC13-8B]
MSTKNGKPIILEPSQPGTIDRRRLRSSIARRSVPHGSSTSGACSSSHGPRVQGYRWETKARKPNRRLKAVYFDERAERDLVEDIRGYLDPKAQRYYARGAIPTCGGLGRGRRKKGEQNMLSKLRRPDPDVIAPGCTLSGLLNVLDDVVSWEARIIPMTFSLPEKLDETLPRPGRIDRKVYLGHIEESGAEQAVRRIFEPDPPEHPDVARRRPPVAGAGRAGQGRLQIRRPDPRPAVMPARRREYLLQHYDSASRAVDEISEWIAKQIGMKAGSYIMWQQELGCDSWGQAAQSKERDYAGHLQKVARTTVTAAPWLKLANLAGISGGVT